MVQAVSIDRKVTLLPQIEATYHEACENFLTPFLELSYRNEGFKVVPNLAGAPIAFQDLLETPNTSVGDWK